MRIDGIQLGEGSKITNLVVANGPAFPSLPNEGELFFRTDGDAKGIYLCLDGEWRKISSNATNLTRRQQWTVVGTETTFTVDGGYTSDAIDIYVNGLKLRTGDGVDASNGIVIVFDAGLLTVGDLIDTVTYGF